MNLKKINKLCKKYLYIKESENEFAEYTVTIGDEQSGSIDEPYEYDNQEDAEYQYNTLKKEIKSPKYVTLNKHIEDGAYEELKNSSFNESLNESADYIDKLKEIENEVRAKINELYADDKDLLDYFYVESGVEEGHYDDGSDMYYIEVRGELNYDDMSDLADKLDPIVQKYDEYAYFDMETSGIIVAALNFDRKEPEYKVVIKDNDGTSDLKYDTYEEAIDICRDIITSPNKDEIISLTIQKLDGEEYKVIKNLIHNVTNKGIENELDESLNEAIGEADEDLYFSDFSEDELDALASVTYEDHDEGEGYYKIYSDVVQEFFAESSNEKDKQILQSLPFIKKLLNDEYDVVTLIDDFPKDESLNEDVDMDEPFQCCVYIRDEEDNIHNFCTCSSLGEAAKIYFELLEDLGEDEIVCISEGHDADNRCIRCSIDESFKNKFRKNLKECLRLLDIRNDYLDLGNTYSAENEQDVFESLDKMVEGDATGVFLKHKRYEETQELTIEALGNDEYILKLEEDSPEALNDWEGQFVLDSGAMNKEEAIRNLKSLFQDYKVVKDKLDESVNGDIVTVVDIPLVTEKLYYRLLGVFYGNNQSKNRDDKQEVNVLNFLQKIEDGIAIQASFSIDLEDYGFTADEINAIKKIVREERVDESLNEEDDKFNYMLLGRLQQDCEYFLGNGNGYEPHLWAGNVEDQIAKMKELYNKVPEKPEWLSLEDIDKYEKDMLAKRDSKHESVNEETTKKLSDMLAPKQKKNKKPITVKYIKKTRDGDDLFENPKTGTLYTREEDGSFYNMKHQLVDKEFEIIDESLKGYKEVAKIIKNDKGYNVAEKDEPMLVEDKSSLKSLLMELAKYL